MLAFERLLETGDFERDSDSEAAESESIGRVTTTTASPLSVHNNKRDHGSPSLSHVGPRVQSHAEDAELEVL